MTSPPFPLEFGLDSFGELALDGTGQPLSPAQTVRLLVDEGVLADEVGLDFYNIGEHYKPGVVDTAGHVILAAIAAKTQRIRVGTSVLVLSTRDPVRVFHDFSTLNAVSDGRAELVVGRASQTESFPLFGFDLADYDDLFAEKLDLLVQLLREPQVTWQGKHRSSLDRVTLMPTLEKPLTTWVGIGGNPQSVVRAANYGLPLMIAIIGGGSVYALG
jgi:alkanesulfonate monooxygenase SsuD/methylene tetrahydromethanopterin reductase-like flavin-dependent oxidoreductase (luciferase family)